MLRQIFAAQTHTRTCETHAMLVCRFIAAISPHHLTCTAIYRYLRNTYAPVYRCNVTVKPDSISPHHLIAGMAIYRCIASTSIPINYRHNISACSEAVHIQYLGNTHATHYRHKKPMQYRPTVVLLAWRYNGAIIALP